MTRSKSAFVFIVAAFVGLFMPAIVAADTHIAPEKMVILRDLEENSLSGEDLLSVRSVESFEVVSLADFSGIDLQALQAVLKNTEDNFAEVQSAIVRNEVVEAALSENDISLRDVQAATLDASDVMTLYVDMP